MRLRTDSHFGFFYKGYRVECTSNVARIFLRDKLVGQSRAISRAAIERDIERVIAGEELV
ncbi:hypothetical protein [Komagataeibacter oboediens]|uniref:hypothetical protein n=1 Tax=Komagataeibacter oboediens TaxID=65958 RepID=UPI000237ECC7|nr:hypothetical protein [Komagataeibacter oboediens]